MLEYLTMTLMSLWAVGLVTGNFFDGYIHLLLLGAMVAFGIRYFTDRKLTD
jgi:hypothetical protein